MEIRVEKIRNKGFTLIELLVVLAIGSIVLLGAFSFFERQQAVFNQQSEQAEKQANLRVAMYFLARDIALAGYTGTGYGLEEAILGAEKMGVTIPARPLIPIIGNSEMNSLTNSAGEPLDAIEIWGNFTPNGEVTTLASNANAGAATLVVNKVDGLFINQVWDEESHSNINVYPTGVVVGSYGLISFGLGDYVDIASVNSGSKTINLNGTLLNNYYAGADEVAPVLRRAYFVQEICEGARCERWLIRRDYYVGKTVDQRLAQGVEDFQIFYDVQDPTTQAIGLDLSAEQLSGLLGAFDPCIVTAVTIRLQARVITKDMPKPLVTTLNRKIKIMNSNIRPGLDYCPLP